MLVYPNVKINLGLSVLRRRPDGYHDIETLFVPYFGMTDVLEIVPADAHRFVSSDNVTWDDDLTIRAYQLLRSDFDLPPVEIRLTKRSAVGAGLGGGSADAAFTLMALTEMFHLGLEDWPDCKIAGVCGGLAKYLNIDPTVVRIIFLVLLFMGLCGGLIYLIIWLCAPEEEGFY